MYWTSTNAAYLRISLAVVVICSAALAAGEVDSGEAEPVDSPLSSAEQMTHDGLLLGISGDVQARDDGLRGALQLDPDYALAHWHLAQIRLGDQWLTLDEIEGRTGEDQQLEEYRQLRDSVAGDPRRELALANWCRRHQLDDAERLHLRRVLSHGAIDLPERRRAMERLGLRAYRGALMSDDVIAQVEAQLAKERTDHAKWMPVIAKWRKAIDDGPGRKQRSAIKQLRALKDPTAISTLERDLSPTSEIAALEVVNVLGGIPEYEATRSLVRHAIDAQWKSVRDAAVARLRRRELHDFAPLVLRRLTAPIQSRFFINVGPDGLVRHQQQFFREGPLEDRLMTHSYVGGPKFIPIPMVIRGARQAGRQGKAARKELEQAREDQVQQLGKAAAVRQWTLAREAFRAMRTQRDVAYVNELIARENMRTFDVLKRITGETLPRSPSAWWEWWLDYNEVYRAEKPAYAHQVGRVDPYYVPMASITLMSCFPAGTQVRGATGFVDIEDVRPGDRVLAQDVETGELAYKLVLERTERPPSVLLEITLGDTTISTTKGHPFWVNGIGWRMAKRLEIGQQLHSIGGSQKIDAIATASTAKAYNLVVSDFGTYFVGASGVLVHDNTYRRPTTALTPGLLARKD